MQANEYQKMAAKTIGKQMTFWNVLSEGAMGICSEAGEVAGLVKKPIYQGGKMDRERIKEELGDVLWYAAEVATGLEISLEDVMEANIEKIKGRYPECFAEGKKGEK